MITSNVRGLLLVLALGCLLGAPAAATAAPTPRITNGTKVDADGYQQRWRSTVSVRGLAWPDRRGRERSARDRHECGGTLVRLDVVVTAAHCVTHARSLVTGYTVLGGTRRLGTGRTTLGTSVAVREIIVHPRYADDMFSAGLGYDVAILRLARPMPGATPMPLIGAGEGALWGNGNGLREGARVAGWGLTAPVIRWEDILRPGRGNDPFVSPSVLNEVEIPLMADRFCGSTDSGMGDSAAMFDRQTMLCGGTRDGIKGIKSGRRGGCMGDSGGPLAVTGPDGQPRLVGVVSWGPSTAGPCNRPTVFARVDAMRDWVEDAIAAFDLPPAMQVPQTLRGRVVSFDALRVEWDATSGPVERLRLLRELSLAQLYREQFGNLSDVPRPVRRALESTRLLVELGRAGEGARSLHARGLAPRAAGSTRAYRLRLEASDLQGRRVLGPPVDIRPALDSTRPERPRPRLFQDRQGVPGITWRRTRDNHCVLFYEVQVRRAGTGKWRTHDYRGSASCYRRTAGEDSWMFGDEDGSATRVGLFELRPARYAVRVVAVDKAGNRSASAPRTARVRRYVEDLYLEPECKLRGDRVVCVYPKDEY